MVDAFHKIEKAAEENSSTLRMAAYILSLSKIGLVYESAGLTI